jgi:hypothetical protein
MGCGPKRRTNLRQQGLKTASNLKSQIKRDPKIQKFKLELSGIGCKFCARAAVELLEQIPGVVLAEYVCDNSKNLVSRNLKDQDFSDQNLSSQFGPGEITSMLDAVYNEAQLSKKLDHDNNGHKHDQSHQRDQVNKLNQAGVNNFPGFVKLYYKPRENLQLSSAQVKRLLNSDGFELEFMQPN